MRRGCSVHAHVHSGRGKGSASPASPSPALAAPREVVHDVIEDCTDRGLSVAPQLALESVRLLQVDPSNFKEQSKQSKQSKQGDDDADPGQPLRAIRAACTRFLLDKHAPGLAATRMRVAFRRKYRTPEDIARDQTRGTESRVAPLLAEVLDELTVDGSVSPPPAPPDAAGTPPSSRAPTGVWGERAYKDRLYGSVVAAAVLRSGLGSPADPAVIKEANAAMQSVYPTKELPHLLRLPSAARRAQLLEVCRISAGVRIFNWDCRGRKTEREHAHGNGNGNSLVDLPTLVQEAASVTRGMLVQSVEAVEVSLWPATAALEAVYLQRCAARGSSGDCQVQEGDLDLLKETVIYLRQQQAFLRRLLDDVEQASAEAERLTGQLEAGLSDVHAVVQAKTAVPTNQVYPQFMSLASTWEALETQAVVVSRAANLYRRLEAYTHGVRTVDTAVVLSALEGRRDKAVPTDAERVAAVHVGDEEQREAARRRLARDLDRGDVAAQLQGFCPWFLAVSGGGIVPGCPALGLCEAGSGSSVYALSSLESANIFSTDPSTWVEKALDEVRRRPALVGLLGLSDALALRSPASPVTASGRPQWVLTVPSPAAVAAPTCDAEVQTEARTAWRQDGVLAAATQTELSAYRREGQVQTFPARDTAVQCPRNASCSTGSAGLPSVASLCTLRAAPLRVSLLAELLSPPTDDMEIPATSFLELSPAGGSPISDRGH